MTKITDILPGKLLNLVCSQKAWLLGLKTTCVCQSCVPPIPYRVLRSGFGYLYPEVHGYREDINIPTVFRLKFNNTPTVQCENLNRESSQCEICVPHSLIPVQTYLLGGGFQLCTVFNAVQRVAYHKIR